MAIPRHPRLSRGIVWFATLLCAATWLAATAREQGGSPGTLPETQAKFVLGFVSYTTWPDQPAPKKGDKPLARIIGVLGNDFGALALEELVAARPAGTEQAITVRRIRQTDDLEGCDVLLLGDGYDEGKWNAALNLLRDKPVLTVGAGRVFAERTGMIGLYLKDGFLRFAVNLKRVEASGIRLSSRMLRSAEIVED